jgi:hypothetical protein
MAQIYIARNDGMVSEKLISKKVEVKDRGLI